MIPKVIHRIWVGSQIPDEFVYYGQTWQKHHPDWQMYLWTDKLQPPVHGVTVNSIPSPLHNEALYQEASKLVPAQNIGQFRADILRYEILLHYGGVYVDTDFECIKPLDPLLAQVCPLAFGAWEKEPTWINNAILGCEPGDLFFDALVGRLGHSVRDYAGQRPNVMSGPQYLTRMFHELQPDFVVFPQAMFYPYLWNQLDHRGREFPEAYAVHHWANRRRTVQPIRI